MKNTLSITSDGKDVSETNDLTKIYETTLLSELEYIQLKNILTDDFFCFYLLNPAVKKTNFAKDVDVGQTIVSVNHVYKLLFLQDEDRKYEEQKRILDAKELMPQYNIFYENLYTNPLSFLSNILEKLNISCKNCNFIKGYFKIDEYTNNHINVKFINFGFRRSFQIIYLLSDKETPIFEITVKCNNLDNKIHYWIRFYNSEKRKKVIITCQILGSRSEFIQKYPYLIFLVDLIKEWKLLKKYHYGTFLLFYFLTKIKIIL